MTILQMQYFVEVARCGSFSKAAEKLFVSQQGISKQILAIEHELELKLIDRSNRRKIALTKEGEAIFYSWEKIVKEYEKSLEEAMILAGKMRKTLRIGIFEAGPIVDYVMPLINGYRAYEPGTDVECVFGSEDSIMNELNDGKLDIAFALCKKYRDYPIKCYPIYYDRVCITLSKKHPLAERKELHIKDLENVPVYVLNKEYSYDAYTNIENQLKRNGVSTDNIVIVKDLNNLEMTLHMGQGVTFAPRILLRNTGNNICYYPVEDEAHGDSIILHIIWEEESMKTEAMKIIGIGREKTGME